ncbi:GSCOCG00004459001-RA-CDS [Cotesia congregata]|nr:GSCOCG00004459001-RA-CDS [Cotesia congregata]
MLLDETQDHRQGRTAFNTESPTSKAKREQVFRNRLAVRRRQALTRSISPKSHLNSTLKSSLNNSQDLLEVQETRHSVYVTAPSDSDLDDQPTLDEESEKEEEDHSTIGSLSRNSSSKNGSLTQSSQMRRKNTVVMPESLYNHFRPVESNIPIEDMTQFRYFGQKIRPENTTSNNSVEVTSTSASPMQRRRFFIKGFSTTATPSSKLEEMINEEMNIAVDKSTVERNKIPKTKNLLRGTNLYLRKSQRSDSLLANVTAKNGSTEGNSVQLDIASNDVTLRNLTLNNTKDESLISKIEKPKSSSVRSKKTGVLQTGNNKEEKGLMMPSESSQVLGRISTWLSINADPMTPSMDRENVSTSSSSLRIVVTEIPANVVTLVPLTSTSSTSSSSILTTTLTPATTAATVTDTFTSATGIPNEEAPVALVQQMHPYAYTITNVTRLLGNYSGPGSNDNPSLTTLKEQVNSWFSPPLATSGMDLLHSTRTPGPVSVAPTAVEHSATTEQSTPLTAAALLVGETFNDTTLQQQVAAYSVHRNTSQASTAVPISTDNPAVGSSNSNFNFNSNSYPNSTEPTSRTSAEEKGHLKKVTDEGEEKTTVSAIVDKEVTNDKKLFRSTTPSAVSSEGKEADQNLPRSTTPESVERKSTLKLTTESGEKVLDKKEVNDRRLLRKSASAVLNQRITGEESVRDSKRRRSDIRSGSRSTKGRVDERVGSRSIDSKDEVILPVDSANNSYNIGSIMANSSMIGESGANSGSGLPIVGEGQKFEGVKLNLSEPVKGNGESDSGTGFGDLKLVSSTVKTPVFPVTPMILDDKDKDKGKVEDQDVEEKVEETAKAPDRPFGIAKDLDPSEIQKMYRSQTTLKPEGTTLPEANLVTSPQTPKMEAKKNGERSPEVRGRNLSDKTKDKDDVLPIMHLYNTSDIFNGTMKDLENRENRTVEVKTVDGEENVSTKGRNRESASNSTKVQNSNPGSSSLGNKTRHKPVYFSGPEPNGYHQVNSSFYEPGIIPVTMRDPINMSEVITKRHDGDTLATQETVVIVSYILAGLVFFPIVVGVVLIFRRLIIKNRKVRNFFFLFI